MILTNHFLLIIGFKYSVKTVELKGDNNYVSENDGNNFQANILKKLLGNENKYEKHYISVL